MQESKKETETTHVQSLQDFNFSPSSALPSTQQPLGSEPQGQPDRCGLSALPCLISVRLGKEFNLPSLRVHVYKMGITTRQACFRDLMG